MSDTPRTDKREACNGNVLCGAANLDLARQLERELNESQAREAQLREALIEYKTIELHGLFQASANSKDMDYCRALAEAKLSLPPPPVVSMDDAQTLFNHAESILDQSGRCGNNETHDDFSETYKAAQAKYVNIKTKYTNP